MIKFLFKNCFLLFTLIFNQTSNSFSQIIEIPVSEQNPFVCSSYLPSSKVADYGPENIFDFDQSTAWVEGVKGDGVGEWVATYLGHTSNLSGTKKIFIGIYSGYQNSREVLANNGAPTSYLITLFIDSKKIFTKVLDTYIFNGEEESDCYGGECNTVSYELNTGFPTQGNVWIKIEILKVRAGLKYKDTAISEVILNFEGSNPANFRQQAIQLIKSEYRKNQKNIEQNLYVLNEKKITLNLSGSECGDMCTLFEYNGKE